jgi:hypothetical protein
MRHLLGQEPFTVFSADSGAGSGGSTSSGDGAGSPAGSGGTGEGGGQSGNEGGAPGGQQQAGAGGAGDAKNDKQYPESYVRELREEAAKHRREKAAIEAKLKALEDEKLSDTERREKRLKELEAENARLAGESRRAAILAQAAAAGAIVPEAIVGLVPADAEDVKAGVAAVKREYPQLFVKPSAGSADAGAGNGKNKEPVDMDTRIRRAAGRMV